MQNEILSQTKIEMAKAKERWEAERTRDALVNYLYAQGNHQDALRGLTPILRVESSHQG